MPSDSSKIRLAVIGTGHLGSIHARLAKSIEDFELVAVVDPRRDACEAVAKELQVEAHANHHALLRRIDAAVLATPTEYHHRVGRELLDAGIDLLIEKPISASLAQANELVSVAEANGCVLQVGHIERFNPAFAEVADEIESPKYIETRRFSGFTGRSTDIGVVMDLMIHDLDLVLHLVKSQPTQVDAVGISVMGDHEDVATARIAFANGCIANLSASRASFAMARDMQVWCPNAFFGIDFAECAFKAVRPSQALLQRQVDVGGMDVDQRKNLQSDLFEKYLHVQDESPERRNALVDELSDFAAAVLHRSAPRVTGEAGRDAVAVCEQILDSLNNHRWDGHSSDRLGPFAPFAAPTVRPLNWAFSDPPRRRAG